MTMLIWSLVWFALFMLGALVYLPEVDEVTGWRVAGVCICSLACLVLSIWSFGLFLWPVIEGVMP